MGVLAAAQRAYDTVPFYRRLYDGRPERLADVPAIGPSAFHRADSVADCVVDPRSVLGAVPPCRRGGGRLPFPMVEDRAEQRARSGRLLAALRSIGFLPEHPPCQLVLVADEETGPLAAQLANALGSAAHTASVVLAAREPASTREAVRALDPEGIVLVAEDRALAAALWALAPLVQTVPLHRSVAMGAAGGGVLVVTDELHAVGTVREGGVGARLTPADGGLAFEVDRDSGELRVTTLAFTCMPLIRYALGPLPGAAAVAEP
jgi:hypothetical protein